MPLCTILTKCPAPLGPQCSQPRSAVVVSPVKPGVRGAASNPGASASKTGARCATASSGPPTIRQ